MKLLRVGAASLNQTPLDWDRNSDNIRHALQQARQQQISIVCLPELCISGYGCEDAFLSPGVRLTAWRVLQELLPDTSGLLVSLGLPVSYNNVVFNVAALAADGRVAGFVAKRYLPSDGIHYEPRWFKVWPIGRTVSLKVDGVEYPFGDIYFDCGGVRIGFEICEDAWVADRPGGNMFLKGVDIIMNPSASHFSFGKQAIRERFVLEGSRAFGVTYVYSNLLGNEAGRAIYDGGAMVASAGRLMTTDRRFSFRHSQLIGAVVDLDLSRMAQARSAETGARVEDESNCISLPFSFPETEVDSQQLAREEWELGSHLKEEEFTRAVALSLFDYLCKSRSRGWIVSLSGGADSSAVSLLCSLAIRLAVRELGLEKVLSRLAQQPTTRQVQDEARLLSGLLTCVYQSTRNSSETTRNAARTIAQVSGAEFFEFDVDPLVDRYVSMVSDSLGRTLEWETDDIALQNIQARVRAPGIWLLANLKGALLLSTSNRSEAAVGYATMDGDTCGGLSPVAGIDKAFLRQWLRWMQETGPQGLGPIPELEVVTRQAPTAELRPPEQDQTDEKDLMPYDLLDFIERAAIRDRRTPIECFRAAHRSFPQWDIQQLGIWVERFFRLWCRNQWKRERYAPSFHLDDENLDPKTWCRFPILSGGFERELRELSDYLRELESKRLPESGNR